MRQDIAEMSVGAKHGNQCLRQGYRIAGWTVSSINEHRLRSAFNMYL